MCVVCAEAGLSFSAFVYYLLSRFYRFGKWITFPVIFAVFIIIFLLFDKVFG